MADFPKSVSKHFPYPSWGDEMSARSEEELRNLIVESRNNIDRITRSMEENPKIVAIEEDLKKVKGPYNDAKKAQDAKIKAVLQILRERGRLSDEPRPLTEKDEDDVSPDVDGASSDDELLEELAEGEGDGF